jgi:hypothetical protein
LLKSHHRKDLKNSGLSDDTITVAGVRSVSRDKAKADLGFDPGSDCMAFDYSSATGKLLTTRYKPDVPMEVVGNRPAKYLTPKGGGNHIYVPNNFNRNIFEDVTKPLMYCEGEKKALAGNQEGFPAVALAGVWCFREKDAKGQSRPIADLDLIVLKGRTVYVVFDSDAVTNPSVRMAEKALAEELESRGAFVLVVRLSGGKDGAKVGLDDYLLAYGAEAFKSLLEEAQHPAAEDVLADPVFVDAGLAFIRDEVLVTREFREVRTVEHLSGKGKDKETRTEQYEALTVRLVSSSGKLVSIPQPRSKDREEILPLGRGYYLRSRPEAAPTRWSTDSVRAYLNRTAGPPDVKSLYYELLKAWKAWVYLPDENAYHLCVQYAIGTYFFPLFSAYPYLNFNGPPDSGKSTNARLFAALAFNAMYLIDPSEASLFRSIERERPTLVIDEKEDSANRQDAAANPGLMALLKAGYQAGARVPRQNQHNIGKTEYFSVYCPKVIANVSGLEDVLADRSIIINTEEAPEGSAIRGGQPDLADTQWQNLRDRLYLSLMHYHGEIKELLDADLSAELARLREKELFAPLVVIASWVDSHGDSSFALPAIVEALSSKRDARAFVRGLTPEAKLCAALLDLLEDEDTVEVHAAQIRTTLENLYGGDRFDWFSEGWLGKTLKSLSIWKDKRDSSRKRVLEWSDGGQVQKKPTHYVVRRNRIPTRWRNPGQEEKAEKATSYQGFSGIPDRDGQADGQGKNLSNHL